MLQEVIVSELTDQFYKIKNLIYEKFLIFITYLIDLYDLTLKKVNSEFAVLKNVTSSFTNYLSKAYEMVITTYEIALTRLNLELSDLKTIISLFANSLSENGKIAAATIAIVILAFALIMALKPKPKTEPGNKASKNKPKSIRGQLLEIEIDLLEIQDKYSRDVISFNSYLTETKRLEERANKLQ